MHTNNGNCSKCLEIKNRYPGFHEGLWNWFVELQKANPDAHVSCCGRGKADQEHFFSIGTSFAHYGQSAHNYNLALDLFRLTQTGADYGAPWFNSVVKTAVDQHNNGASDFKITWPLQRHGKVMELPHCELLGWDNIKDKKLVE